ncbi:hypothetical protein Zm00014a_006035 [Zea mays]|uniref:Uncharacterized protein n=2 Tax=Zea mays TaxID=4577 RepID=A0A8J8XBH6_MAIZE|nr:embryo defective 1381 [Zea mays]PWZ15271.1 hypothetical protein Zm00014a_006035 [Zea mays]
MAAVLGRGGGDLGGPAHTFGWTPQEAKLHMVSEFFSEQEWKVVDEVLGPNPRQLSEIYMLKQKANSPEVLHDRNIEEIIDTYLAHLQVSVVNPAMEKALKMLQEFASDVREGKVPKIRSSFGAPWRHPPRDDNPDLSYKWAKIQLMDFIQSFVNTEFGVNYLADDSLEILDDPAAVAMMEVGLLYQQREPSFMRPITRGIQRCLARWFVLLLKYCDKWLCALILISISSRLAEQRLQLNIQETLAFFWQRLIRGRSYRHLMKEVGYK